MTDVVELKEISEIGKRGSWGGTFNLANYWNSAINKEFSLKPLAYRKPVSKELLERKELVEPFVRLHLYGNNPISEGLSNLQGFLLRFYFLFLSLGCHLELNHFEWLSRAHINTFVRANHKRRNQSINCAYSSLHFLLFWVLVKSIEISLA